MKGFTDDQVTRYKQHAKIQGRVEAEEQVRRYVQQPLEGVWAPYTQYQVDCFVEWLRGYFGLLPQANWKYEPDNVRPLMERHKSEWFKPVAMSTGKRRRGGIGQGTGL